MEINNVPHMGEAYLAISVLGEEARGEHPHDHTAQQCHGDKEGSDIDPHRIHSFLRHVFNHFN